MKEEKGKKDKESREGKEEKEKVKKKEEIGTEEKGRPDMKALGGGGGQKKGRLFYIEPMYKGSITW